MQSVGESCIGAIDEEKEEEIRGANIKCSMELIGGRWLADAEQHNNQPSRGNRSNLCRDLESNKAQKHNNQPNNSD